MRRRDFQKGLAAVAGSGVLLLSGCGFTPRQAPDMPFKTLAFNGFANQSVMADELRMLIDTSRDTRVVDDSAHADAILDVLLDASQRNRDAITTAGQIRSIAVVYRFKFRVRTPAGKELMGPVELVVSRSMSYNESAALAKEKEELSLLRAMQRDVADQVMYRLSAIKSL